MTPPKPGLAKCHSCRRSRLRCDGTQPICEKCTSRGVECLGYGAHALLWVQQTSRNDTPMPSKKGRPKLVLLSSRIQQEDENATDYAESADLQQGILDVICWYIRADDFVQTKHKSHYSLSLLDIPTPIGFLIFWCTVSYFSSPGTQ